MKKVTGFLYALTLSVFCSGAWARVNDEGIDVIISQAEGGDASAQTQLGIIYAEGDGVTRDYQTARNWFELAGKQNYADAEYNLGVMYGNGDGVAPDKEKARQWFEKAAVHGNTSARYNLGVIYSQDTDTLKDPVRAEFWFIRAAEEGSSEDKYTLGVMYSTGERLSKDDVKARKWFEMAANEDHVLAQYNLAVMYSEGLGGERSLEKARDQANKAAVQGDPEAARLLVALNTYSAEQKKNAVNLFLVAGNECAVQVIPPARLALSSSDKLQSTHTAEVQEHTVIHTQESVSEDKFLNEKDQPQVTTDKSDNDELKPKVDNTPLALLTPRSMDANPNSSIRSKENVLKISDDYMS